MTPTVGPARAHAEIDLSAYAANVRTLASLVTPAQLMCVVKADGYGHGIERIAATARAAGAHWLGVAFVDEALALRAAGDSGPLLAWLLDDHDDLHAAVAQGIDISIATTRQLARLRTAASAVGVPLRVHVELDTGLSRGGAAPETWPELFKALQRLDVVSIWSHLACADEPGHPSIDAQRAEYERGLALAAEFGVVPRLRHLANSAAALTRPDLRYDLVRIGIAAYGIDPMNVAADRFGLAPVMTVRAAVAQVRDVAAGAGVSYGHRYTTAASTRLALLPLGYADGLPRAGTNRAEVLLGGRRHVVSGTICMDQFVVDVDDLPVAVGDPAVVFGAGGPSAEEWANACGTIGYELTTRIGARLARRFIGGA